MTHGQILALAPHAHMAAAVFLRRYPHPEPGEVYAESNLLLVRACRSYRRRYGTPAAYVYTAVIRGLTDAAVKAARRGRLRRRVWIDLDAVPARESRPEPELTEAGRRAWALALLLGRLRRPKWSRMIVHRELAAWMRQNDVSKIFDEIREEI